MKIVFLFVISHLPPTAVSEETPLHTLSLTKLLRIDETEPEILDMYLIRAFPGNGSEQIPVLMGNDPRLPALNLPASLLTAAEGYTFFAFSELNNLQVGFGADDPESGLRYFKFRATEAGLRQSAATGSYSRAAANNSFVVIEGRWNPDNTPVPQSARSSACSAASSQPRSGVNVVQAFTCNVTNPSQCTYVTPTVSCYCTTYGREDSCFVRHYIKTMDEGAAISENSTGRALWRDNRKDYWHMFEFEIQLNVTNYALLTTSRKL